MNVLGCVFDNGLPTGKVLTEYAMWNDGWDWLVIAHENSFAGAVSVQFHPPSRRLPKRQVTQPPARTRELEPA